MKWLKALRRSKVDSPEKSSDPPERLFVILLEGSIMDAARSPERASEKLSMLKEEIGEEADWWVQEYRIVRDSPLIH